MSNFTFSLIFFKSCNHSKNVYQELAHSYVDVFVSTRWWDGRVHNYHHHQYSAQEQVLYCKLRHQGCNYAQRQVFHCKLRNVSCSFTRDE